MHYKTSMYVRKINVHTHMSVYMDSEAAIDKENTPGKFFHKEEVSLRNLYLA